MRLWHFIVTLKLFRNKEKTLYRNLKHSKLEKKKSQLTFNETRYNNDILRIYTNISHACKKHVLVKTIDLHSAMQLGNFIT